MSTEAQQGNDVPSEYLLDLTQAPEQPANPAAQNQPAPGDDIPEQFRGKTPAELVKIIRDSQSEIGRARNEIGQVRRLADELLGIRAVAAPAKVESPPPRKPLTTDSLLQDPEQAVTQVVREEAERREASTAERIAALERDLNLSRFELKHPGYQDTLKDPKFADWLQRSSYRLGLAQGAHAGNFSAADELLTLYKESQSVAAPQESQPSPTDKARAASLARSGGAAAGAGSSNASRQVWSRAKLLDMRIHNPDEFERLQPEILRAYQEKRVR